MPTYRITDPTSGKTLRLTGDSPPTENELEQIFAQTGAPGEQRPIQRESVATKGASYLKEHPIRSALDPALETLTGKGIAERVDDTGAAMKNVALNADLYGNNPISRAKSTIENTIMDTGAQLADMATSPINLVGGKVAVEGGKLAGRLFKSGADLLKKAAPDYINQVVAPRATKFIQQNIQQFTPAIESFAERTLKVPKSAINTIKAKGVAGVEAVRQKLGGSTDAITQRIEQATIAKQQAVENAYDAAFSNLGQGAHIPVPRTKKAMADLLEKAGWITKQGGKTKLADAAMNDATDSSALKKIYSFYESFDLSKPTGVSGVNPFQWNIFRNNLSKARTGDKQLSGEVTKVLDALHSDAERAGLKGITQARNLAREQFRAEDDILSSVLTKEGKLDKFHTLSEAEKRKLVDIEKYLGTPFLDDLSQVSAGKYVDKIMELNPKKIAADLNKAKDPAWTKTVYEEYKDILGQKAADEIFQEVLQHQRASTIVGRTKKVIPYAAAAAAGAGGVQFLQNNP